MSTCDRCHRTLDLPQRRITWQYCDISLCLCFACSVVVVTALNAIKPIEERAHRLSVLKEQWQETPRKSHTKAKNAIVEEL